MSPAGTPFKLHTLYRCIAGKVKDHGIKQIATEDIAFGQYDRAVTAHAEKLAIIKLVCGVANIEYGPAYNISSVKKEATGNGRASKEQMVRACQIMLGHNPIDHNAADAVWILNLACRGVVLKKTKKKQAAEEKKLAALPGQMGLFPGMTSRRRRKK